MGGTYYQTGAPTLPRTSIGDFSSITGPLHELTRKEVKWEWTDACYDAFLTLKRGFITALALKIYDWSKPAVVEVDASNWASGGVFSQKGEDGELYPVAYFSAKHSSAECNYDIYDKELLAIIKALEEWRSELEGTADTSGSRTDRAQ